MAYANGYTYRKTITIDYTKVAGGANLSNFPIVVAGTDANLKTTANGGHVTNANGYDIVFASDTDGATPLKHEVELWVDSTGEHTFHVKIPTLSYTANTVIYMFYGKSSISTSQADAPNVWDANFKPVYHCNQDPSGSAPQLLDSTSNDLDGTSAGSMTSADLVAGAYGKALEPDGTDDRIVNTSLTGDVYGIEVVLYPIAEITAASAYNPVLCLNAPTNYFEVVLGAATGYLENETIALVASGTGRTGVANLTLTTAWHHLFVKWDSGTSKYKIYWDGTSQTTINNSGTDVALRAANCIRLFNDSGEAGAGNFGDHRIAEVRIHSTARTEGWIQTSKATLLSPSTFYSTGSEEGTGVSEVSVTKALAYKVKTTPSAKTKALAYKIKTVPSAITKAMAYSVVQFTRELFLDTVHIESASGVSYSVNTPTKYGSNPIFGNHTSDTWDNEKFYASVIRNDSWPIASRYRMWYPAFSTTDVFYSCYAYSSDGINFAKPNLGLVSYGGNTNNNILLPAWYYISNVIYNPAGGTNQKYIFVTGNYPTGGTTNACAKIFGSENPDSGFVELKQLSINDYEHQGESIMQRADGRWMVYYQKGALTDQRAQGAWLSDTTDITGSWTDLGTVISYTSATDQPYFMSAVTLNELVLADVNKFNSTTNHNYEELYISRNGQNFTQKSTAWIPNGAGGAWDSGTIWAVVNPVRVMNEWWFYYGGGTGLHDVSDRHLLIGVAKIGYNRIGQVSGTGTVITKTINTNKKLFINANGSGLGNKIEVEVLDASNDSVITGYSKDDMTDITTDTYGTEVKWGSNSLPTNQNIKIKFYLTGATIYSYGLMDAPDTISEVSVTKTLAYKIKTTPAAIQKDLIYWIVGQGAIQVTKTKALAYRVKTVPAAKTKALAYKIKKATAITKGMVYVITGAHIKIMKALAYRVKFTHAAITKGMEYVSYEKRHSITKDLTYRVKLPAQLIQKTLTYDIDITIWTDKFPIPGQLLVTDL